MEMAIFTAENTGLQNVYTPLTPTQHFCFCLIATIIYLVKFYRDGGWQNLLLIVGIDITYLTQTSICTTGSDIAVLGVAEAVILITALVFNIRYNKMKKGEKLAAEAAADFENERRENAENEQREQDEKIVDNAFDE